MLPIDHYFTEPERIKYLELNEEIKRQLGREEPLLNIFGSETAGKLHYVGFTLSGSKNEGYTISGHSTNHHFNDIIQIAKRYPQIFRKATPGKFPKNQPEETMTELARSIRMTDALIKCYAETSELIRATVGTVGTRGVLFYPFPLLTVAKLEKAGFILSDNGDGRTCLIIGHLSNDSVNKIVAFARQHINIFTKHPVEDFTTRSPQEEPQPITLNTRSEATTPTSASGGEATPTPTPTPTTTPPTPAEQLTTATHQLIPHLVKITTNPGAHTPTELNHIQNIVNLLTTTAELIDKLQTIPSPPHTTPQPASTTPAHNQPKHPAIPTNPPRHNQQPESPF